MSSLLPLLLLPLLWIGLVLPQKKRLRAQQELLSKLAPGDEVMTTSGIYGTITEVEDGGTVLVEVSQDTEIRMAAAAISQVIKDSGEVPTHDVSVASTPE